MKDIITLEQANAACNLAAKWYAKQAGVPYEGWGSDVSSKSKMEWFLESMNVAALLLGLEADLSFCVLWSRCMYETGAAWFDQEQISDRKAEERYGWRSVKAHDLGNTDPGDGKTYKGRGVIMLTGKDNYVKAGKYLGLDLAAKPLDVLKAQVAGQIVHWYIVSEMPSRSNSPACYEWLTDENMAFDDRVQRLTGCILYGFYQRWNDHPSKQTLMNYGWKQTLQYGLALAEVLGLDHGMDLEKVLGL